MPLPATVGAPLDTELGPEDPAGLGAALVWAVGTLELVPDGAALPSSVGELLATTPLGGAGLGPLDGTELGEADSWGLPFELEVTVSAFEGIKLGQSVGCTVVGTREGDSDGPELEKAPGVMAGDDVGA